MSYPHGMRFSPFSSASKTAILSAQQQPQQQTPVQTPTLRQSRNSANPSNIPTPTPKIVLREKKTMQDASTFSDTDDDEQDYFDNDSNANLSREERYVLLQPRAEPQGQENLSGNVTPVNDAQPLHLYEKVTSNSPVKMRFSSADSTHQQQRYGNSGGRSVSVDLRHPAEANSGSHRNSLNIHPTNRNSSEQTQSNRSSLDVSQSSYNTLIIHDNNETQPLFAGSTNSPMMKQDLYFLNSSPSPPNYTGKKDKILPSRSLGMGYVQGNDGKVTAITENEQQYLNQSFVLKHLAKEVRIPQAVVTESTRDSGVSSANKNWSGDSTRDRNKSKSQPDLTKLADQDEIDTANSSETNTLNHNDFEQLEVENTNLRVQLNDCLMKVAKSQKLEQEVTNIYKVHEELVASCERRERLERTARTRLQSDCRRLQELNRVLRDQVEVLQQQLITASTQQQQMSSSGRSQQDLMITQLVQQNKELIDANKRQYIEIQAQSATLEEQRIHINVLDSALKRLEEEIRQKQLYQKQLQSLLGANERRDKMRLQLEDEMSKDKNRSASNQGNAKWEKEMGMDADSMNLAGKMNQQQLPQQDVEKSNSEAQLAQNKVNEMQLLRQRLKLLETRLAEKEKDDLIRQLHEQKLFSDQVGNPYGLLGNNDYNTPSSSCVSSTPTTPLIYNPTNYDNLPSANSSKTVSSTSNASFDAFGAYSGFYQPNFGQKLSSAPGNSGSMIQQQHQHQQPSTSSSNTSNYLSYDQSLDEQRKSIDDQLKRLDNQLLTKICCFPSNLLGKKAAISDDMTALTSNTSEAFLQNLAQLRMQRDNTPVGNMGKSEDIVLLEKQGRCSQNLRSNLAQVSSTIGQNMADISNICQSGGNSKLPKIVLPPRKDRQSSAPPSALPRPPRTLKPPRKIEYGRLSETGSSKSNSKSEYEMKTSSLKRQSPVTASGSKNYVDIKSELQMALNSTKNAPKSYGSIKNDTANNITKIYYSNKPDYVSSTSYQRLPESPSSCESNKKFSGGNGSTGKKGLFMRSSPTAGPHQQSREGSISSGSNSRSSPKLQEAAYQQLARSRTRTPPKYLHLSPMPGGKFGNLSNSNNSSPTKPTLPSSSVLYHQAQAQNVDWKHQRGHSGRSNSGSGGENKYRIQF